MVATVGTLGMAPTSVPSVNAEIAATINQLSANQRAIMSALSFIPVPVPANPTTRQTIAIQQLTVPIHQQFPAWDYSAGPGVVNAEVTDKVVVMVDMVVPRLRITCTRKVAQVCRHRATWSHMVGALSRSSRQSQHDLPKIGTRIIQTPTSDTTIGASVSCMVLMLKMCIPPRRVPLRRPTISHLTLGKTRNSLLRWDMEPCTKGMHKTVLPSNRIA